MYFIKEKFISIDSVGRVTEREYNTPDDVAPAHSDRKYSVVKKAFEDEIKSEEKLEERDDGRRGDFRVIVSRGKGDEVRIIINKRVRNLNMTSIMELKIVEI